MTVVIGNIPTTPLDKTPGFQNSTVAKGSSRSHSCVHMNGVVYVASYSDHTYDYSSGSKVDRTSTPYLAAYDRATGKVITTWNCALDDGVEDLCLVNGGAQLAIAGAFTTCCGSTRRYVALVNTLSGPTDTSSAALASGFADMGLSGGQAKAMWPNSRGETQVATDTLYVGGQFSATAVKIKKTGSTWAVDGGFDPSAALSSGYVQCVTAKSDKSLVFFGGTIPNSCQLLDGATGAKKTFGVGWTPSGAQHCIAAASDDTYIAFGGDAGPNICFVTDWTGSGPRSLPAGGAGAKGYDYYEPQGNIQGIGLVYTTLSPSGKMWGLTHHDVQGAATTSSSAAGTPTFGVLAIQYGPNTNGTAILWANPPKLAGTSPEVLKGWGVSQDRGPDLTYQVAIFGDYESCNGDSTKVRYSAFQPTVTGTPPPPPPPPADTWTCPDDGSADGFYFSVLETAIDSGGNPTQVRSNVVGPIGGSTLVPVNTVAPLESASSVTAGAGVTWTQGTWSNSPTSYTYQLERRPTGGTPLGSPATLAGLSYTTLNTDVGFDVRVIVTATNAHGSTTARSGWTTVTGTVIVPVIPTIVLTTPPTDITLVEAVGTLYTVAGVATSDSSIASCFVNSQLVTVDGSGNFSRQIALAQGANLVTVVATDSDGDTATTTNTITLVPPTGGGGQGGSGSDIDQGADLLRIQRELNQRGLE